VLELLLEELDDDSVVVVELVDVFEVFDDSLELVDVEPVLDPVPGCTPLSTVLPPPPLLLEHAGANKTAVPVTRERTTASTAYFEKILVRMGVFLICTR
jgi:hypothetical protein